ncbi:hypothetical protein ACH5RR_008426 [Cinchona calisaya]|uniref:Uncharacterized protein n=1 Tax=Cinchona calisaya TaxID=153742 RepID=A0ABD3ABQ3_9GENT
MVKGSYLEEVGVCVLDSRMGRLTPGVRVMNLFDCIRSSREIGYFFGFFDSMGEVDEEEDEAKVLETRTQKMILNQILDDDALTDSSDEIAGKETNTINVLTKEQDLILELIEQIAEPEKWQLYLAKFKSL